ncbi:MAG TPA: type II toxin-antitoxin system VapC family toxin [Stellaceae bacterium]|jgi:hypothetical protein
MIVIDTNVLSVVMRPDPDRWVFDWLNRQPSAAIWTTAVSIFEIRFGLELLPPGRRRSLLERAFDQVLDEMIEGRILTLDAAAAQQAAILSARYRRAGIPQEFRDSMIAGIAVTRRATLATRNTRHFPDLPIPVIDPWAA